MKKVAYISNFYAIPPLKGAAVQTWTNEVAKRLWFYEPHTIEFVFQKFIKEFFKRY